MMKIVDGKEVPLTPADVAEHAAMEAEWVAQVAEREKPKREDLVAAALDALIIERAAQPKAPQAVIDAAAELAGL